jgi:hypothetical protein
MLPLKMENIQGKEYFGIISQKDLRIVLLSKHPYSNTE